jgi:hypothetical protein
MSIKWEIIKKGEEILNSIKFRDLDWYGRSRLLPELMGRLVSDNALSDESKMIVMKLIEESIEECFKGMNKVIYLRHRPDKYDLEDWEKEDLMNEDDDLPY